MTKTYNIISHGDVVNTNGILSNFSATNYATLPIKLPTSGITQLELDLEFTTGPDVTTERCLISQTTDDWAGFKIDIVNGHLWIADASTDAYTSNYTFNINTLYYIRLLFDGTGYNLYISTDGKNYNTQESFGVNVFKTQPNKDLYLGSMYVTDSRYFNGTINLSGCSLIINNQLVWRGVTTTGTRIVNRNDTSRLWTAANPVLAVGEMGVETDTNKFKFGDGTTAWSGLAYAAGEGGGDSYTKTETDDLLSTKQDKLNTLTPIDLSIITNNVITSPLAFNESLGGYANLSLPYYCTYFEETRITNYEKNRNLQFFKDYGYVDIPYKFGQIASYSFSYGTDSGMHQGMSANNIAYGRWVGDNFDLIMLQSNTYNGRLQVYPSYEVDSSGNLLNPITINLNEKTMADGSRYPTVYGGNQNIFQIIDNKIYTYAPTNTGLRQAEIPSNAIVRVSQITDILIIPYYRPDNNEGRGTDKQPIFVSENSKVDGTMLFDTGGVAYPDLFPAATQSTWSTLFENAFANKNILLQGETSKEYLVLKYDNKTLEVNESGQLTCTSNMLSDSNFIDFCTANANAIKAALGLT